MIFKGDILESAFVVHRSLGEKFYLCTRYELHVSITIQPEDPER